MNRPSKIDVTEHAELPACAAGEPLQRSAMKSGRRDVAARLLQFISLLVLFAFGLIGISLHALRPTGITHPVLKRHIVSKLNQHKILHLPASPPVYTMMLLMNLSGVGGDDDEHNTLHAFTKRVAPELVVVSEAPSSKALEAIASALPRHERTQSTEALSGSCIFYSRDMWRVDKHGALATNSTCMIHWARLQPTTRHHSALAVATLANCDPHSEQTKIHVADLRHSADSAVERQLLIVVGDVNGLQAVAEDLIDPFNFLYQKATADNGVLASASLRPISASSFRLPRLPDSFSPVSIVFEIQSPV